MRLLQVGSRPSQRHGLERTEDLSIMALVFEDSDFQLVVSEVNDGRRFEPP